MKWEIGGNMCKTKDLEISQFGNGREHKREWIGNLK